MSFSIFAAIVAVLLVAEAPLSNAWGPDGHYMTCRIAQDHLTWSASSFVLDLLPPSANGDLASVCSWADRVRHAYPWTSPLHYVNTPDNLCNYDYTRDCHDSSGNADVCVVGAINNYTTQLQAYANAWSSYNATQALMFLAHFMGDIHQPLHCGFASDAGGNGIPVYWYNVKTNLHSVWDSKIVQNAMEDYYGNDRDTMADSIGANVTSEQMNEWDVGTLSSAGWANNLASESIQYACNYAYKDASQNTYLTDSYFLSRRSIAETRIAQGGIRLATLLNRIF